MGPRLWRKCKFWPIRDRIASTAAAHRSCRSIHHRAMRRAAALPALWSGRARFPPRPHQAPDGTPQGFGGWRLDWRVRIERRANLRDARRRQRGGSLHQQHPGHGGQLEPDYGIGGDQLERIGLHTAELPDSDQLGTGGDTVDLSHLRRSGVAIATIDGATTATLSSLLAHSIT